MKTLFNSNQFLKLTLLCLLAAFTLNTQGLKADEQVYNVSLYICLGDSVQLGPIPPLPEIPPPPGQGPSGLYGPNSVTYDSHTSTSWLSTAGDCGGDLGPCDWVAPTENSMYTITNTSSTSGIISSSYPPIANTFHFQNTIICNYHVYVEGCNTSPAEPDCVNHTGTIFFENCDDGVEYFFIETADKDYKGIMQKSCWLLLISLPKMNPEIWKGTPREKEDYEKYQKAQETLTDLKESGYCAEIIEQQGTNKPNQSFNLDGAKSALPS